MGFLAKLFGSETKSRPIETTMPVVQQKASLPGPGLFAIDVVGELKYQEALESICGPRNDEGEDLETEAQLIHEDNNAYDSLAIRVDIGGSTVGYLSRENARQYRAQLTVAGHRGLNAWCKARIRGGWDRGARGQGKYGVVLDLPADE